MLVPEVNLCLSHPHELSESTYVEWSVTPIGTNSGFRRPAVLRDNLACEHFPLQDTFATDQGFTRGESRGYLSSADEFANNKQAPKIVGALISCHGEVHLMDMTYEQVVKAVHKLRPEQKRPR